MKEQTLANVYKFSNKSTDELTDFNYISTKSFDFSVVTAVYNSELYLREAINSIIQQSNFENIQFILVNDGSSDSSLSICLEYAKIYPDNIIVVDKPNGGVSSARNFGMLFAQGTYINFMDSDDKIQIGAFARIKNFFDKNTYATDVVTIKNELFGAKKGDSWFNQKFNKGDRIINLWGEPTIYLNSVNNCFFHKRIKNQLYFDENINIAEDLKVVNTVLMNKYKLGVMSSCIYYYRVSEGEHSLVNTCKTKEDWYCVYLDRVFNWLYEKSIKQCGCFVEFLQYTLLRDLFNRFNDNTECEQIMNTPDKLANYRDKLFYALSCIDDKIITKNNFLNSDYQLYFLSIKHGAPLIINNGNTTTFSWGELSINKMPCVYYEKTTLHKDHLTLEGYVILNNIRRNDKNIEVYFTCNNIKTKAEVFHNGKNDKIAFADEVVFFRKYFKVDIPLNKKTNSQIRCSVILDYAEIQYTYVCYGKWCGINLNTQNGYLFHNNFMLTANKNYISVKHASKLTAKKCEKTLQKELKNSKDPSAQKARLIRKYYFFFSHLKHRQQWLISDRHNSAYDNGEALFKYMLKKHTSKVKYHFAVDKNCNDYYRLKKTGKVLAINSIRYKLAYLMADVIVSSHLDNAELNVINNKYVADIVSLKQVVFLQHGVTKDDVSSVYSRKIQNIELFITSAKDEYDSVINTESYFLTPAQVGLTGLARFDRLKPNHEKIILVMPTWRNNASKFNSVTNSFDLDAQFANSSYLQFFHPLLSDKRLHSLAQKYGYKIVYFPHNNMVIANEYFKNINNIHIVEGKERNYTNYLSKASILITDYSSTAFDFAYLRKPLIYCQSDKEEFFSHHTYTKGYFDYEKNGLGPVVYDIDTTITEIERCLINNCKCQQVYLDRMNHFFPYNDRNNCQRIYNKILELGGNK